jgi:hypothetical protein
MRIRSYARPRWFVGHAGRFFDVFKSRTNEPGYYTSIVGPFKTKAGAEWYQNNHGGIHEIGDRWDYSLVEISERQARK